MEKTLPEIGFNPKPATDHPLEVVERYLWFSDGFWWYRTSSDDPPRSISAVLRSCGYQTAAIARELRIGDRTFHRRVKESLGIPPGLWLRGERAADSRHRLRAGFSVKELAYEYGFMHQGDFTAEFKRWHGVTPAEFRRSFVCQG